MLGGQAASVKYLVMDVLLHIIETYGLWVVFAAVLLDQGGLPVPSYPLMIAAAALAAESHHSVLPILIVAILATLLADLLWFAGGRRFGASLLRTMCKLSLSPDSCVGLTRRIYGRWGPPSLIFAKYIPGFAAVATTLAGETGISLRRFAFYDTLGAALWAGGAIALGAIFHEAVGAVLIELERLGHYAVMLLVAAVALFIAVKWWQRRRFLMTIRMARISVPELVTLFGSGSAVTVLDVRSPERRLRSGWIPGSIDVQEMAALDLDPEGQLIVYCDCPNDASAAVEAAKLRKRGFRRVRPLAGGVEAWLEHGLPLDRPLAGVGARLHGVTDTLR
jgi:membrane protein DedA with SNARE-associated domain/rhodanese-related sulfurtransferase